MKEWYDYLIDSEQALNINNQKYLTLEDYKTGMKEAHELVRKTRELLEDIFLKT